MAGDVVTALVGVGSALSGAGLSYLATARAARKAGAAAWAGHTISLATALLASDDPTMRAAGTHLLAAAARAVADAPETPERIKEVTRSGDLADAVDEVGRLEAAEGEPVDIEVVDAEPAEEDDDGEEGPGQPQAG
jgi:hypothetical protein